jgi:hypothetical protein
MPLSFFAIVDSVMTRPSTVRCGKWRRVVCAIRRCARIMRPIANPVKGRKKIVPKKD